MVDNKIATLRNQKCLTQQQLADLAEVDIQQIQELENDVIDFRSIPISTGLMIARALGVQVIELVDETDI
jgi:transcriptional regulator with XRE-family HTH domain